jgi:hypothetical protein
LLREMVALFAIYVYAFVPECMFVMEILVWTPDKVIQPRLFQPRAY